MIMKCRIFLEEIKLEYISLILNYSTIVESGVHNHSGGRSHPTGEDFKVTERIRKAAELLVVLFCDHIIITGDSYFNFSEEKRMVRKKMVLKVRNYRSITLPLTGVEDFCCNGWGLPI